MFLRFRARSSGRSLRGHSLLWALCTLALVLARESTPPALAQGHQHQWTAGAWPAGLASVTHIGGQPVTETSPAYPCEILELRVITAGDGDFCTALGCPFPGGTGADQHAVHRGYRDHGALGHFGFIHAGGHFQNQENFDPDLQDMVAGGVPYYRVSREQANGSIIQIAAQWDDSGFVVDPATGQQVVAFNDDPNWSGGGTFPVDGTKCNVKKGRGTWVFHCVEWIYVPCDSAISPIDGSIRFSVPVCSWGYRGTELNFSLTYSSRSLTDASLSFWQVKHPAALSDQNQATNYNPLWTHSFAQWIEVLQTGEAVWHKGDGTAEAFEQYWNGTQGPFRRSHGSFLTLTSSGSSTSPWFTYEDDQTRQDVPFSSFVLKTADQTEYTFDIVRWNIADHPPQPDGYAIPYFLLRQIRDRWARTVTVVWNSDGVASVTDGDGRGLVFDYSGGLVVSITDPFGRVHTISHTTVQGQKKPTGITVQGIGSPNRTRYLWAFEYNSPTGDFISRKTTPSGKVVNYEYETVANPRVSNADWVGRMVRSFYTDDLMSPPQTYEIRRSGTTIIYPGEDRYQYTFQGAHLHQVRHESTGAAVNLRWDLFHNLAKLWTAFESEFSPLVSLAYGYTNPDSRHIAAVTATDVLGNQASATFNDWKLPTEFRAFATPGSGRSDQMMRLIYDGGGPLTAGNVTRVTAALGTPSEDTTDLLYQLPLRPDLPSGVIGSEGGLSEALYHVNGSVSEARSPENLLAPVGDADRPPSISRTEQNAEELPSAFVDPMGHRTEVSFNAEAPNSSRLVITLTHNDGSTRKIILDADGLVVELVDENGVRATVERNRSGQPLRVKAAVGTAWERTVLCHYDGRADLVAIDPPKGASSRISFEYCQYQLPFFGGGPPTKTIPEVYIGKPTRVIYSDGSEYIGYNGMEEIAWRYGKDGKQTTLHRDSLHRVYQTDYPGKPGYPAFSVGTVFDEFGRPTLFSDANGNSLLTWDDLNRLVSYAPAIGNAISKQYLRDTTLRRWTERVTMPGVGSWEFREDGKGREAEVLNPFGQLATRRFDPDSKLLRQTRGNGTYSDFGWTPRDWLASITHRLANGAVLDTFQYFYTDSQGVYDPTGRLRREIDVGGRVHEFFPNPLSEPTASNHPDTGPIAYGLDLHSNRVSKTQGGVTEWYGVDAADKLLWTNQAGNFAPTPGQAQPYRLIMYDLAGQPTDLEHRDAVGQGVVQDKLDWDGMGKLRRLFCVGAAQERYRAKHDGSGTRVEATLDGTTHTYSFGAGLLHDSAGSTVYTPGISQRQNGVDRYFHDDWIGSTRYLTDASGLAAPTAYRYDAFGLVTAAAGPDTTSLKFAGGWGYQGDVAGGLLHAGARQYAPALGRFMSPDPIGLVGGLNRYVYCGGNPVGMVDPSGEALPLIAGIGLILFITSAGPAGEPNPGYQHQSMLKDWRVGWIDPGLSDASEFATGYEFESRPPRKLTFGQRMFSGAMLPLGVVSGIMVRGVIEAATDCGKATSTFMRLGRPGRGMFNGMEVRGMHDLSHLDNGTLSAMAEKGFAAKDSRGVALELHHHQQNPGGPLIEIPADRHKPGNRNQHPFGNTPGSGLTPEQRDAFNAWRKEYWRARAAEELRRRGVP